MDTLSFKTKSANAQTVKREWFVIDAEGKTLGRMCTRIASVLRGKHKPSYTPHFDTGDYVIVLNADKIRLTGNKLNNKIYYAAIQVILAVKEKQRLKNYWPKSLLL